MNSDYWGVLSVQSIALQEHLLSELQNIRYILFVLEHPCACQTREIHWSAGFAVNTAWLVIRACRNVSGSHGESTHFVLLKLWTWRLGSWSKTAARCYARRRDVCSFWTKFVAFFPDKLQQDALIRLKKPLKWSNADTIRRILQGSISTVERAVWSSCRNH